MALRRSHGYEEMDGTSHPENINDSTANISPTAISSTDHFTAQEIELTTVSVVPDDTFTVPQAVNALGFGWFQVKLSLATGLCWMADSMEMSILSMLAPALHCHWGISKYQQALVTTVVFMGMMLSSTFWGHLSDRYGRKPALTLCSVLLLLYGLLSAVAPSFLWLLLLRGLVGFAIGCVPQSVTLYAEFLPTQQRAKCVVLLDCFWALGACLEVVLALAVMPTLGWRWLLGLSTIPLLAFAIVTPWLPESARYHIACGQTEKALSTLHQVAKDNGRPMLLGRLVLDGNGSVMKNDLNRGRLMGLLAPHLRQTSLLLWAIWMACAFCYYGLVLMTTELFAPVTMTNLNETVKTLHEVILFNSSSIGNMTFDNQTVINTCHPLTTPDYMDLLWTTLAEFPGIDNVFVFEQF
ncbi:synaptic vesicle 2-related protein-like [Ctenocephalides felis]|uniref:synaptic vesicle 2-related protein-like n=1 Tax=Ctenocephalides felis TaxID=7515 RepID=UPI000E6E574A|nr:synaptic vesicle 2-related protein-like [Ctenocephalides felis]